MSQTEVAKARRTRSNLALGFFFPVLLLTLASPTLAQIIPSSRMITWDAGTRSDLTARSTICTTLSPSGNATTDTAAIKSAIAACPANQVVKLNAGTFKINSPIIWGAKSNVTLRGSGRGVTILAGQAGFSRDDNFFDFYINRSPDSEWSVTPAIVLSSGLTKGSTRIVTSSAHGWVAGDYLLLDQLNDAAGDPPYTIFNSATWLSRANGTRVKNQMVKVTTVVNSTAVDIDPPLYYALDSGKSPQGKKANVKLEGISIERMTINNHASAANVVFYLYNVFNSLFYDLDIDGIPSGGQSRGFHIYNSMWLSIKHSRFHGGEGNATNQGYGIFIGYSNGALLIEDNIFDYIVLGVATEGGSSGHIIAYNYATNSRWNDNSNRLPIINHGGANYVLMEGNVIDGRIRQDVYFGTGNYWTYYRNRVEQMKVSETGAPIDGQEQTFDIETAHHYSNVVGNVLGTSGYETVYEHSCVNGATDTIKVIYRLGYPSAFEESSSGCDALVKSTMLRHRNWDSVTAGVKSCGGSGEPGCQGGDGSTTLPLSLYLPSKPSWFGSLAWPAIGPDLNPMASAIPAQQRYSAAATTPSPPPGLVVY